MKNALVIIDMQPGFLASRGKNILNEQIKQIEYAISNNHHIVIIEYKDFGNTHKKIRKAICDYKSVGYITKDTCSGSYKLAKYFKKQGFWPKEIKFMGVNTGACVKDTVLNFNCHLKRTGKKTKIKIIKNGCRCEYSYNFGDFSSFEKNKIEVI